MSTNDSVDLAQSTNGRGPLLKMEVAARHLQLLGIDPGQVHLRAIHWSGHPARNLPPTGSSRTERMQQLQRDGFRLYLIAGGAQTDAEVTSIPAVFAEWDGISPEEAEGWLHELQAAGLPESTLTLSTWEQGSLHSWWRLAQPCTDIPRWQALMKRLVIALGSDLTCTNPSRLMRLAGSAYFAKAGHPQAGQHLGQARIRFENEDATTSLEELEAWVVAEFVRRPELAEIEREVQQVWQRGDRATEPPTEEERRTSKGKVLPPRSREEIEAALAVIPRRVSGLPEGDPHRHPFHRFVLAGLRDALYRLSGDTTTATREAIALMEAHSPGSECGWDVAQALRSSLWLSEGVFWGRAKRCGWEARLEPQGDATTTPAEGDPFLVGDAPPDFHAANLIHEEAVGLIASVAGSLFRYAEGAGYWSPWAKADAEGKALATLRRMYQLREPSGKGGRPRRIHRYGSAHQAGQAVAALRILAGPGPLRDPAPPAVIVFENGTYDIRGHRLGAHDPGHGATYGIAAPFVAEATCPVPLRRVIETCFPEGAEPIIRALFRWGVDPGIRYGEAFHLLGDTGTGKGILLEFLIRLFPGQLVATLGHPSFLNSPDRLHQFVRGKRLVAFPDTPARPKDAGHCGIFYDLVENTPQSTRKLHASDAEDARPMFARCVLGSVAALQFPDGRDGFLRRVRTIQTLPRGGDTDSSLKYDLVGSTDEHRLIRGQVVSWALAMALEEVEAVLDGNDPEGLLREAAADAARDSDTVSQFVDACLIHHQGGPDADVGEEELSLMFEAYLGWCRYAGVQYAMQRTNFLGQLRKVLGPGRCLARRKESSFAAAKDGRSPAQRANLPRLDAGFQLRPGILMGFATGRDYFDRQAASSGGLATIAALPPVRRQP